MKTTIHQTLKAHCLSVRCLYQVYQDLRYSHPNGDYLTVGISQIQLDIKLHLRRQVNLFQQSLIDKANEIYY